MRKKVAGFVVLLLLLVSDGRAQETVWIAPMQRLGSDHLTSVSGECAQDSDGASMLCHFVQVAIFKNPVRSELVRLQALTSEELMDEVAKLGRDIWCPPEDVRDTANSQGLGGLVDSLADVCEDPTVANTRELTRLFLEQEAGTCQVRTWHYRIRFIRQTELKWIRSDRSDETLERTQSYDTLWTYRIPGQEFSHRASRHAFACEFFDFAFYGDFSR